jgi:hypothetical protein
MTVLLVLSCTEKNQTSYNNEASANSTKLSTDTSQQKLPDSTAIGSNIIEEKETFINPEFLDLVKSIDSLGYLYDSIRLRKSYRGFDSVKTIHEKGYLFYETELKNTVPFSKNNFIRKQLSSAKVQEMDSIELKKFKAWKKQRVLNFKQLEKVKSIYSYHFIAKKSSDSYRSDGIIEQWEFDSKEDARKAAEDLGKKERFVYFNRGAYVCYLENYVYIFHSRSAGFYTPLKKFINLFITKNKAITTKDSYGRCPY